MITVIAQVSAKTGKEKDLENALKSMFPKVQNEEGTLSYILHRSEKDDVKFLFYEKFKNKEAFEYHNSTQYIQELFEQFGPLLANEPDVEIYEEIATIDR